MENIIKIIWPIEIGLLFILIISFFIIKNENINRNNITEKDNDKVEDVVRTSNLNSKNIIDQESILKNSNETVEENIYEKVSRLYKDKMSELESTDDKMQWFIEYKDLINEYADLLDPPETIYDYFTEEELDRMFRVVQAEVGDDCYTFEQKCNVASVILYRIRHDKFPDEMNDVLVKKQFTTISNGKYKQVKVSDMTRLACEYSFEIENTAQGCLFFDSNGVLGAHYKEVFSDGAHHFYTISEFE